MIAAIRNALNDPARSSEKFAADALAGSKTGGQAGKK